MESESVQHQQRGENYLLKENYWFPALILSEHYCKLIAFSLTLGTSVIKCLELKCCMHHQHLFALSLCTTGCTFYFNNIVTQSQHTTTIKRRFWLHCQYANVIDSRLASDHGPSPLLIPLPFSPSLLCWSSWLNPNICGVARYSYSYC